MQKGNSMEHLNHIKLLTCVIVTIKLSDRSVAQTLDRHTTYKQNVNNIWLPMWPD